MSINYCPECGSKILKKATYCGECGTKISIEDFEVQTKPNQKLCHSCHYSTTENEIFCPECGNRLASGTKKNKVQNKSQTNKTQKPAQKSLKHCPACRYITKDQKEIYCAECGTQLLEDLTHSGLNQKLAENEFKKDNKSSRKFKQKHSVGHSKPKSTTLLNFAKAAIVFIIVGIGIMYYFDDNNPDYPHNDTDLTQTTREIPRNDSPRLPVPKVKEIIAEKMLSYDNLTITSKDGRVRMTASPTILDGDTKATIARVIAKIPDTNISLSGYDFNIGKGGELSGVVNIEMPYSQDDIARGYTAEQSIFAVYYDENNHKYEPVHYELDKQNKKLIITTSHLTKIFKASVNPADYHNNPWIYVGSLRQVQKPNWGVFYTTGVNKLNESAYKFDFNKAKSTFKDQQLSSLAITQKVQGYGFNDPNIMFIDEGLSLLGKFAAYPENTGKLITLLGRENQFNGVVQGIGIKGAKLSSMISVLGNVGMVVAIGQLGTDLYEGRDHTAFKLIKNIVYWKGDVIAEYGAKLVFGFSGFGTYVNVALVSMFAVEQVVGPLETWNEVQRTKMLEHKKLFSAYTNYTKHKRREKQWLQILNQLNKKAMTSKQKPKGMQKGEYFEKLLRKELNDYTNYFWDELPSDERTKLIINSPEGYYYGHYALVHYAGHKTDKKKYISTYIDEIAAGKYPTMKLSMSERYLVNRNIAVNSTISYSDNEKMAKKYIENLDPKVKKAITNYMFNYIMEYKIQPIMTAQKVLIMIKSERELHKALVDTQDELNEKINLEIIDNSSEKQYANHIIMPISKKIKDSNKLKKWRINLNKKGKGKLTFTTLAYLKNGGFTQLGVFPPKTKDFSKQNSILLVGFNIDKNHIVINLENTDVPIERVEIEVAIDNLTIETVCGSKRESREDRDFIILKGNLNKESNTPNQMIFEFNETDYWGYYLENKINLKFKNINKLQSLNAFSMNSTFSEEKNGEVQNQKIIEAKNIPFTIEKGNCNCLRYSYEGNIKKYIDKLDIHHYGTGLCASGDNGHLFVKSMQPNGRVNITLFYD